MSDGSGIGRKEMKEHNDLRILIIKGEGQYIAQGLEIGIFAQAETLELLVKQFCLTYLLNKDLAMARPAPDAVFEAWKKGKDSKTGNVVFGKNVFDRPVDVRLLSA